MDRTSNLEAHATVFKKSATTLKRKLWWKNAWLWVLIVILLVVVRHFYLALLVPYWTFLTLGLRCMPVLPSVQLLGVGIVVILWREGIIHFPHSHSHGSSSSGSSHSAATTGSKSSAATTGSKTTAATTGGGGDTATTGKGGSNDGATTGGKSSATATTTSS